MENTEKDVIPILSSKGEDLPSVFQIPRFKDANVLGKKLSEARKLRGMSQKDVAASMKNYGNPLTAAAVSRWEKGDTQPSALQFLALCDILQIGDAQSFFTGRVPEPPEYSPDLDAKGQNLLRSVKDALIASGQYRPKGKPSGKGVAEEAETRIVRINSNLASAGLGNMLDDDQYEELEVAVSQIPERTDFGIRIAGDSMEPYYKDGQIVWIEQCRELRPGEVGIFILDGEGYIKQYRESRPDEDERERYIYDGVVHPKISLVSFNAKYAPIQITSPDFEIVGRVLN
ncbi:MAG: helix-turn-helix domain-containing protein [Oscillospiraceae bacterium]|nr:helix-turn-helix domain-containing protein [Oscillospiraceae bacterium]